VEDAREHVAALAGESPRDVLLTSGGTEANNLGLRRPFVHHVGHLITSRLEHPSALRTAEDLAERGVTVTWLSVDSSGRYAPEALAAALESRRGEGPTLVAVHAVHHETGVVQPIGELTRLAEEHGAQIHVDAVQAAGRVDPSWWRGAHTVALAAHKLRGPKGIGALITRAGIAVRPILLGGSQERGLRPGTVDPIAAAGFGVAARRALEGGPERYASLAPLRDRLELAVTADSRAEIVASTSLRAPHVSLLLVDGWRGDELVAALDLEGVCVSSGSACAAGTAEPSPAVVAIVGAARASSALRVSLGETAQPSDIDAFLAAFERVVLARR
jgi:cysteine desulfurase